MDQKKAGMEFTKNVNDIQRDQHVTDNTNAVTGEKTGNYVKIQGDKTDLEGTAKHASVNPKLKVLMIW